MINSDSKGFTLIELLVVVAILGLLATIVAVSLTGARSRARDGRRASDIRQIELALELYYSAESEYPDDLKLLVTNGYLNMATTPTDPSSNNSYCYAYGENSDINTGDVNQFYHLGAVLENSDSDLLSQDKDFATKTPDVNITWKKGASSASANDCDSWGEGGVDSNNFNGDETLTSVVGQPIYDRAVSPR